MDIDRCARVILSGAGRETGHLVDDPVRMAAAIVGRDAVVPAAHALADDWVSSGGTIISADDPTWPEGLVSLGGAQPLLLWVRGSLPGARCEMVSVVGSRECTAYGRDVAAVLARQACASGLTVVSGGALGIDSGCEICGGNAKRCDEASREAQAERDKPQLFYRADQ